MRRFLRRLAAGAVITACNSAPATPSGDTGCDPLAVRPTTLATILGVGKDEAGLLYVADQGGIAAEPSIVRVFVGNNGSLVRQHIIGSGAIGNSEDIETFESADGSTSPRDLTIDVASGGAVSMTLGPEGSGKSRLEGGDAGPATSLTLVGSQAVQGMPAMDLPGSVQYVADAADGEVIIVTSPLEDELGSAAFHLFYGRSAALVERPIVSFNQAMSGFPTIGFAVGSETFVMAISSVPSDGGLFDAPGPVTLTRGTGGDLAFTLRVPTPSTLVGFTFQCLGSSG